MSNILVVEDHEFMIETLVRLVQKREDVIVTSTQTAEEALDLLTEQPVDLVLVDISLPKMNGIDLVAKISKRFPTVYCLILSGHNAFHYVHRALDAGARGYLLKDNPEEILEGIEQVLSGEVYISHYFDAQTPGPGEHSGNPTTSPG